MIAAIAALALIADTGPAPQPSTPPRRPPAEAATLPAASLTYGLQSVCLPRILWQAPIDPRRVGVFDLRPINGQKTYGVIGAGRVSISEGNQGSCVIRAQGDAGQLRGAILETLRADGAEVTKIAERDFSTPGGMLHQEGFCVTFSDRRISLLITTPQAPESFFAIDMILTPGEQLCQVPPAGRRPHADTPS